MAETATVEQSNDPMVDVFSPEGVKGKIPYSQTQDFYAQGGSPAVRVTSPEGSPGWLPSGLVHDYITSKGFKLGPPGQQNLGGQPSTLGKIAREATLGLASSALPETQSPVTDLVKSASGYNAVKSEAKKAAEAATSGHPIRAAIHSTIAAMPPLAGVVEALTPNAQLLKEGSQALKESVVEPTAEAGMPRIHNPAALGQGVIQTAAGAVPVIGPAAYEAGKEIGQGIQDKDVGQVAHGVGRGVGTVAQIALGTKKGQELTDAVIQKTAKPVIATAEKTAQLAKSGTQELKTVINPVKNLTAEQAAIKATKPRNSKTNFPTELQTALPDTKRVLERNGSDLNNITLQDTLDAATQAKKDVWNELQQNHTGPAADFQQDTTPVAEAVRETVTPRMREQNPALAKKIDRVATSYEDRNLSVQELEDRVKELNNQTRSIEARYPDDKNAAKLSPRNAYLFAERDTLRQLLLDKLDEVTGSGAQELRQRYGNLNSFQDVLSRRIPVASRANPMPLSEMLGRLYGPGKIAKGLLKTSTIVGAPSGLADIAEGALVMKNAKNAKLLNDPDFLMQQAMKKTTATPPARLNPNARPPIAGLLNPGPTELPPSAEPLAPGPEGVLPAQAQVVTDPRTGAQRVQFLTSPQEGERPLDVQQLLNQGNQPATFTSKKVGSAPTFPLDERIQGSQLRLSELRRDRMNATPDQIPDIDSAIQAEQEILQNLRQKKTSGPAPPQPSPIQELLQGGKQEAPAQATPVNTAKKVRALQQGQATAGVTGADTQVKTPNGNLPAKYKLVEADSLTPSHNALSFAENPNYPKGIQERDYARSKEAQTRVIQQAQMFDPAYVVNTNPDAVNGPSVVTPDGIVLGGNSRAMALQRVYRAGGGDAYRQALKNSAGQFGIDPAQVDKMKQPVLVREIAPPANVEEARRIGSDLNKSMTGALGVNEKAVSAGRSVKPETLSAISNMVNDLGDGGTLRAAMQKNGREIVQLLQKDGVITDRERPALVDTATGGLSEEGKTFVERTLVGSVVDDPRLMESVPKSVLNKLEGSLGDLAEVGSRSDEYNLLPLIREALADHAEMVQTGMTADNYLRQGGMFGPQRNPAVDALVRALAGGSKDFRAAVKQFSQDAKFDVQNQGTLAGLLGSQPSATEAFNNAFGTHLTEQQFHNALLQSVEKEGTISQNAEQRQTPAAKTSDEGVRPASRQTGTAKGSGRGNQEAGPGTKESSPSSPVADLLSGKQTKSTTKGKR